MPTRPVSGFDWDEGNRAKCTRHGLTLDDIEHLFSGLFLQLEDPAHSTVERRLHAIGRAIGGRHALVAFTYRTRNGRTLVRPISARYMHRKEIERYERQAPPHPDQ